MKKYLVVLLLASCNSATIGTAVVCHYRSGRVDTVATGNLKAVWLDNGALYVLPSPAFSRGYPAARFVTSYKILEK